MKKKISEMKRHEIDCILLKHIHGNEVDIKLDEFGNYIGWFESEPIIAVAKDNTIAGTRRLISSYPSISISWIYSPTTSITQAQAIIEKEKIGFIFSDNVWIASKWINHQIGTVSATAETFVEAAARCYAMCIYGAEAEL